MYRSTNNGPYSVGRQESKNKKAKIYSPKDFSDIDIEGLENEVNMTLLTNGSVSGDSFNVDALLNLQNSGSFSKHRSPTKESFKLAAKNEIEMPTLQENNQGWARGSRAPAPLQPSNISQIGSKDSNYHSASSDKRQGAGYQSGFRTSTAGSHNSTLSSNMAGASDVAAGGDSRHIRHARYQPGGGGTNATSTGGSSSTGGNNGAWNNGYSGGNNVNNGVYSGGNNGNVGGYVGGNNNGNKGGYSGGNNGNNGGYSGGNNGYGGSKYGTGSSSSNTRSRFGQIAQLGMVAGNESTNIAGSRPNLVAANTGSTAAASVYGRYY